MMPFKIVYAEGYDLKLGQHVFPSEKFRLIREALEERGVAAGGDFVSPEPALDADLLLVHSAEYVGKLKRNELSYAERMHLEIPWTEETRHAFWLSTGGTILAARLALRDGWGANLGGGFHHAFTGHGEGFCAVNDVAVGIRKLQSDGVLLKAMTVDTDVHQGNGTASIFQADDSVFTVSLHQKDIYPEPKQRSDIDVELPAGTGNDDYMAKLEQSLVKAFETFSPELVLYVAGADPFREDQLGGLALTEGGIKQRDEVVFEHARKNGAAVAMVLAGGYARDVKDTVRIHLNTLLAAKEIAQREHAKREAPPDSGLKKPER
jgi:acetoin utilization deacetylase AcuC-like enzyme